MCAVFEVPRVDFKAIFRKGGVYRDEFNAGRGVDWDAGYPHTFGWVWHGNNPQADFGAEAVDFNTPSQNFEYVA